MIHSLFDKQILFLIFIQIPKKINMAEALRSSDSWMNRVEQKKFLVDKFPGTQIVHIGESEETVITFDWWARLEIHWPSVETRNNLWISVFFPLPSEIAKIIGEPADIFISLPHDAELEDALRAVFLGDDNKDKSFLENHPWSAGLNGPHRINPIHDLWVKKSKTTPSKTALTLSETRVTWETHRWAHGWKTKSKMTK